MAGLKFRVLLDTSSDEEIFRDILIKDNDNFESFYKAILKAYAFSDDQMASFYVSNHNWDKGYEISLFDMSFGEDPDVIMPGVMSTSTIRDFIQDPNQRFILVHDFIKMWIFLIELIAIEKEEPESPKTVLEVGNAPDENSRSGEEDIQFETEVDEDEEDEYGFGEFESYDDYDF